MRRTALVVFGVALVAFGACCVVPYVLRDRDFPSAITNPSPVDVVSLNEVPPGGQLCMNNITVEPHSEQARVKLATFSRPGPPIELQLVAPGYRESARLSGGYPDNTVQGFRIDPPSRALLAEACLFNRGSARVAFYAASDRARSRVAVLIDGVSQGASPSLGFWEREPVSISERAGTIVERMAFFRGPFGHEWLLWIVLVLFVLGTPAALGFALWRGFPRE